MRLPLIISASIHVIALLLIAHDMNFLPRRDFEIPNQITVELVEIAEKTETTKIETPPPRPVEKQAEKKTVKEEPKTPPKAIAPPSAPPPPEPEQVSVPTPEQKKEPEKKPEPPKQVAKPQPPQKRPQLPDTQKQQPENVDDGDFTSVLKNLLGEQPQQEAEKADDKAAPVAQIASLGQRMTISEMDALRRQLERCWNIPIGAREAQDLVVDVQLVVNQDRTVRDAQIVDRRRYAEDSFFRAAADSALRAVLSAECNPLELPRDKYDQWRNMTFRFNPREMF